MAVPTSTDELLDLVRKSELIESAELAHYVHTRSSKASLPTEPKKLARQLIKDGLLTKFQAEQLLMGKYKPFTLNGKYRLLERIGVGGMALVYLCEHLVLRRQVAIKVLPSGLADLPATLERFRREARLSAALDHPNIVRTHDIDQDGNMPFLVMEYVDGRSFQEIVSARGPLPIERAAHYVAQAALGLQHAHERGLVHRDVKPSNLLLDREGVVKLLDLGLARFFLDESDDLTQRYGRNKNVLGTADYVAPEQALDSHGADIRADVYGLGCTFYFLLTGTPPFQDFKSLGQKLMAHQNRRALPVRQRRPDVPEGLEAVLTKMMAKRPAHRYQTPLEVVQALEPWTRNPIDPPSESEMPRLCPAVLAVGSTITSRTLTMSAVNLGARSGGGQSPSASGVKRPESVRTATVRGEAPPPTPTPRRSSAVFVWTAAIASAIAAGLCGYFLR
jgi:serine/threonine protein kinase